MIFLVLTEDCHTIEWKDKETLLKEEVRYVWNLQKRGIIRNIWFVRNSKSAVLMVEAESEGKVKELFDTLPLVKEQLIRYKVLELAAYDGYERLFLDGNNK